jgi:hypothetical protein
MAVASLVFGACAFGSLMVYSETVAPENFPSLNVTMPNGDVVRNVPDYFNLKFNLNGRSVEIPHAAFPQSEEFMSGLQPAGNVRIQGNPPASAGAAGVPRPTGQFRIQRVSGGLDGGVIQIEQVGN